MKHILGPILLAAWSGLVNAGNSQASFADDPAVIAYVHDLAQRQAFDADQLLAEFAQIHPNERVLQLIKPPELPSQRSWERYRARFVNDRRIDGGVHFWQENRALLAKARALYGVPEEIIVAIIGVETEYGRNTGGFSVLEALATLAFHYPPRAEFFRTELEQLLLLSRENNLDPLTIRGSYAGAIGIPQFMPGSQRRYAVDFDRDNRIDLGNSTDDAIGSVAHFLEQHGWQAGRAIAVRAQATMPPDPRLTEAGIRPSFRVADLVAYGIQADAPADATATFVELVSPGSDTQYWLGFDNFYVITRYNRSSFYAMSVFQLAEAIRSRLAEQER